MPNRRYQAGYRFEKRVTKDVSSLFDTIDDLLYYSVESRGSKGKADIVFGLFNKRNGVRTWFGIQCKKGFISKPEMMRCTTAARQDNGMFLFFATLDKNKKDIVYNPSIKEWIDLWMTNTII
jgi:hypothetical protein|tara:strand:+ start:17014 stop:17379 length:366 start_codon:yes stop_codon:yes gene_type:complete